MATKATSGKLKTASVLAFERKLDPSDALMFSGEWQARKNDAGWNPIALREKSVRGTISNRLKTKDQDPAKVDASIENPNLQTVDVATLPHTTDTVLVQFSLRVLPGMGSPSACNDAAYQARLNEVVQGYVDSTGFSVLAQRYATNLANGRFLWRNRIGAENVEVQVTRMRDGQADRTWTFDAFSLSLGSFDSPSDDVKSLGQVIETGLAGDEHILLDVKAFARLGAGQEVFPSQELILDSGASKKSRTLYDVDGVAGVHSQKIGNALRTIDTWYPRNDDNESMGPIAVEPYGSVTTQGAAYRQPKAKQDFYNLLDNWLLKSAEPPVEQQHYVMAVLIRGGVFGDSGK